MAVVAMLAVALVTVQSGTPGVSAAPATGSIEGTVFEDINHNGVLDGAETGIAGIEVRAYDDFGGVAGPVTSGPGGQYSLPLSTLDDANGTTFRVEFTIPAAMSYLNPAPVPDAATAGTIRNGSDVQFSAANNPVAADAAGVDFAVANPASYCQADPDLITTCFTRDGQTSGNETVVRFASDESGEIGDPGHSGATKLADDTQTGSTYGVAHHRLSDTVYVSAYTKRGAGYGTSGPGAIYAMDAATGGATLLVDLGATAAGSVDRPGDAGYVNDSTVTDQWLKDYNAFEAVGKTGLGDIEMSEDGTTLYAVGLADKSLYTIPINPDGTAGTPVATLISAPACTNGEWRPFALGVNKGLVHVGGVCDGSSGTAADLTAYVQTFDGTNWSTAPGFPIPLNYDRRCGGSGGNGAAASTDNIGSSCATRDADWKIWTDDWTDIPLADDSLVHAQPMFTDIEFTADGSMVLGFRDRFGDQQPLFKRDPIFESSDTQLYEPLSAGDLLKSCLVGGSYVLESNGTCGGVTTAGDDNVQGPGGGEYFYGEYYSFHDETVVGGVTVLPNGRVAATAYDTFDFQTGGIFTFEDSGANAGLDVQRFELYAQNGDVNFGKANGLGDLQAVCDAAPIQIGNFVWFDTDNDGVQDPSEPAIPGVTVTLLDAGGNVVATTVTDPNGEYYFDIDANAAYTLDFDFSSVNAADLPTGVTVADLVLTQQDNDVDDNSDSDAYETAGGDYRIDVAPHLPGENDHTLDIGVSAPPAGFDVALAKTLSASFPPADWPTPGTSLVTFDLTVTNQGDDLQSIDVTDYVQAGFTYDPANNAATTANDSGGESFNVTWTGAAGATAPVAEIRPTNGTEILATSETITIPITLTLDASYTGGDLINWAEISDFDDDTDDANGTGADGTLEDVDSTPDGDQTNDNQPSGPGAPGDDVITEDGKNGGDEDDHDVAGVPVYDLSLIKTRSTGQPYVVDDSTTPPTASFDITVINQGNQPAYTITVVDHLPTGTAYTAGTAPTMPTTTTLGAVVAVTDNGDGTFTVNALDPGDSVVIPIVLDITDTTIGTYLNAAEISGFDNDTDPGNTVPAWAADVDSTPGDTNSDPVIDEPSDPDFAGNSHNDPNYDPDGDGNVNEATPDDEDDHDQEQVVLSSGFDLALAKTIDPAWAPGADWALPGTSTVDFAITLTNQSTGVQKIEVTDYVQSGFVFDPANNTSPFTITDTSGDDYEVTWFGALGSSTPTAIIEVADEATGLFDTSETMTLIITLTLDANYDGSALLNWAEISNFDDNTDPADGDAASGDLIDNDSTPNADISDDNQPDGPDAPGDDEIDGDGDPAGSDPIANDEDDHDVAGLPVYDLSLIKERSTTQPYLVDLSTSPPTATFDITVINQALEDAYNIAVDDYLPAGTSYTAGSAPAMPSTTNGAAAVSIIESGTGTYLIDALAAGDSVTFSITIDINDMTLGEYANGAEITSFDNNAALTDPMPAWVVDVDSTPDGTDDDPLIDNPDDPDNPGNSHNDPGYDPDGDGNLNEATPDDEDDHDREYVVIPFDLALAKFPNTTMFPPVDWATPGGSKIAFDIVLTNQGQPVQSIDVTDYVQPGFTYDPADNPVLSASDTSGDVYDVTWGGAAGDTAPTATVVVNDPAGSFVFGESITIPIVLTLALDWDGGNLVNWAEISNFDDNTDDADGDAASGDLVDIDSTPNTDITDDNQPTGPDADGDNHIDGDGDPAGSDPIANDEDDHDVAGLPVWDLSLIKERTPGEPYIIDLSTTPPSTSFDITVINQGDYEAFLIGVTDYLPAGMVYAGSVLPAASAGGNPVVVTDNGDGTFAIDRLASEDRVTFTIQVNITTLASGEYVNGAEITTFDDNADPDDVLPWHVIDVDSTPDDVNDDPVIDNPLDPDNPGNSHNDPDYDPNGDGNLHQATPGDEDDHDNEIVVIPFDLALQKQLNEAAFPPADWATPGTTRVTFDIVVHNQGATVQSIDVTDYVQAGFEWLPGDNPAVTVTDSSGSSFDVAWSGSVSDPAPVASITATTAADTFEFGESMTIPVVLLLSENWDGGSLVNWAEISNFDDNTDPTDGDAESGDLDDLDSTPDGDITDDNQPTGPDAPGDDEIDGDGDGNDPVTDDEDDHDVAGVPVWDLSLIKTRAAGEPYFVDMTTLPPTTAFDITVINQGDQDAFLIGVTDYLPADMIYTGSVLAATTDGGAPVAITDNGDGTFVIDALAAGDSVTFTMQVEITSLDAQQFVNAAEITSFDDNDDPTDDLPVTVVDIDSTPDGDNTDPLIENPGDPENPGNSHNIPGYDPDGDGNVNEPTPGDEDDHDAEIVELFYDLALDKKANTALFPPVDWADPGSSPVAFDITLHNQGGAVQSIDVTDYVQPGFFYDPDLNPQGTVGSPAVTITDTSGDSFDYVWSGTLGDTAPVAEVVAADSSALFTFGETMTITIVLTLAEDWDGGDLINWAEISNFDNNTDPNDGDAEDGSIVDIDSTPDGDITDDNQPTGPDAPGDDEINGDGDGNDPVTDDEDDHDVAGLPVWDLSLIKTRAVGEPYYVDLGATPPTASWDITVINQGDYDAYLIGVTDYLPAGLVYAGSTVPATTAGGEFVLVSDNADGTFEIDRLLEGDRVTFTIITEIVTLEGGPLVNGAEITTFDDNDDPTDELPWHVIDVDSTPDATNDDPVLDNPADPDNPANSHNDPDYDPNGDGNLHQETPGDEDDHDNEVIEIFYDLALDKKPNTESFPPDGWAEPGVSVVIFDITVHNQGGAVQSIDVTDYVHSGFVYDPANNGAGTVTDTSGDTYDYAWTGALGDTAPSVSLIAAGGGFFTFGESITVPIALTVDAAWDGGDLINWAEISNFDNNTDPEDGDANDGSISDIDSIPNRDITDDPQPTGPDAAGDDEINGDGNGGDPVTGDEDDHDVAGLPVWDLSLIKTRDASQPYIVDISVQPPTAAFEITVINQGDYDAYLIGVADYLDPAMSYQSSSLPTVTDGGAPVAITDNGDGTWVIDTLAEGDRVTFGVVVAIDTIEGGPLVNGAEITTFDNNDDPDDELPWHVIDVDSTPDGLNDDPVLDNPSDPDNPGNSHNDPDYDPNGDGNLHQQTPGDEDDHDNEFVEMPYDLALAKVVDATQPQPIRPGDVVTFFIDITNQGGAVRTLDVADYVQSGFIFRSIDNPAGAFTFDSGGDSYSYEWDGANPTVPVASIVIDDPAGAFTLGETMRLPIRLQLDPAYVGGDLHNWAEISNFDNNTDPDDGDASDGSITDVDSIPNRDITDDPQPEGPGAPGDDVIDGDGSGTDPVTGDEDDHDVAEIVVFDLALLKTLDLSNTDVPIFNGAQVTFSLQIVNQSSIWATDVAVIDYVDTDIFEPFDPALNPAGSGYSWAPIGAGDGLVTLADALAPGASFVAPITLVIAADADLTNIKNIAEITTGTGVTEGGDPVLDPSGDPVVDTDSTPDANPDDDNQPENPGDPTDDVIDNTDGDEDDHDIAGIDPPPFSLGNVVWADYDNDGAIDTDEPFIAGVDVVLFTDLDGDGQPDDTNNDGAITVADAARVDTTDADGLYLFQNLAPGDYIVAIPASEWATGAPLDNLISSTPTSSDPNDDTDVDDNGMVTSDFVISGIVTIAGAEPLNEVHDNDPITPDTNENLTVDFGFWEPRFDLALRKTVATTGTVFEPGDSVTFDIEVFNQGNVAAFEPTIVDYLPANLTLNDADWTTNANGDPEITLTGVTIDPGASVTVQITTTIGAGATGTLVNNAEIADVMPVDDSGNPVTTPDGQPVPDVDSTPDRTDGDPLVDDVIDNTGADEDDHDTASIPVTKPETKPIVVTPTSPQLPAPTITTAPPSPPSRPNPQPSSPLAFTGTNTMALSAIAAGLILTGGALVMVGRRRDGD